MAARTKASDRPASAGIREAATTVTDAGRLLILLLGPALNRVGGAGLLKAWDRSARR